MNKLNGKGLGYLFIIFAVALVQSFLNKNYVIGGLFFVCVALSLIITNSEELYDKLYCTLLVAAVFEYTAYVPGHEKIYFFHIMLFITAIFTVLKLFANGFSDIKIDKKILGFYIIWFIYICASYFWSKNKSLNIKYIIIYSMMFLFLAIIVVYNNSKERLANTMKVLGFMFLIVIAIGLIEAVTGVELPVKHYYSFTVEKLSTAEINLLKTRPMVFSYNPNNFGTLVCLAIPFLFNLFFYVKNNVEKVAYLLWSLAAFAAVVLSTSRSNLMAIIVMLGIAALIVLKEKKFKGLIYALVIILGFVATYKFSYLLLSKNNTLYIKEMQQKINKIENLSKVQVGEEGSEGERVTIVYDVVQGVFHDKKLFGFGAGNTTQQLMDKNNTHGIYSPHSLLIEILGDFGIFFTILYGIYYLYLIYRLFGISRKPEDSAKTMSYSLITMLIGFGLSSFAPSSVTYFLPYWMMYGVTISCINLYGNR